MLFAGRVNHRYHKYYQIGHYLLLFIKPAFRVPLQVTSNTKKNAFE